MTQSPTEPFWRRPIVRADADPLADLPVGGGAAPADERGDSDHRRKPVPPPRLLPPPPTIRSPTPKRPLRQKR